MTRCILHVDMDAFFASVEQRDTPSLGGLPVLVGGDSERGVVAAASYEARRFGIHSAMPMVEAKRRCPKAIVLPPRMDRYIELSQQIFGIFRRYTPLVEGLSLDEAFLDVTGSQSLFGPGPAIAARIRSDIFRETQLTASAGVASNKFVAKIASTLDKPNGLFVVARGDEAQVLAPLPMRRMWGIGPRTEERLVRAGFSTVGSLARASVKQLESQLGSWGRTVHQLARGIDERPVVVARAAKSLGAEVTFPEDLHTLEAIETQLLAQSQRLARRLVRSGLRGTVVTLKIKYANHQSRTRRVTLHEPVADTDSLYQAACKLLAKFDNLSRGVRLAGVSISEFNRSGEQHVLFPDAKKTRREHLEQLASNLEDRFGTAIVTRAALLKP